MSCPILYRKTRFIVVKSFFDGGYYFTIINTKKRTHCHVHKDNFDNARMICYKASKNEIPIEYPEWMKVCIRRIL